MIKSTLLVIAAFLPCACTTVVEPAKPDTTTTVHRETRTSTVYPMDAATRTQTTTTIRE